MEVKSKHDVRRRGSISHTSPKTDNQLLMLLRFSDCRRAGKQFICWDQAQYIHCVHVCRSEWGIDRVT
jgi:hypothetical protein